VGRWPRCEQLSTVPVKLPAQEYIRDVMFFIFLVLVLVAGWTSMTKCRVALLLNRQQTEEWKGWMQV
jgi:10 TM Acyl Transferase domain found in Cas1p